MEGYSIHREPMRFAISDGLPGLLWSPSVRGRAGLAFLLLLALGVGMPSASLAGDAEALPKSVLLQILAEDSSPNRWAACKFYMKNASPAPFRAARFRTVFFDSDGKPVADTAEAWIGGMDVEKAMPGCEVPMAQMEAFTRGLDEGMRRAAGAVEAPPAAPRKAGPGEVVIGPGEWSPAIWAGVPLNPPVKLGPNPDAAVAAFDADGAFLGQVRNALLAPLPGAKPADPPKPIEVYKAEPDAKSQHLAVHFVFRNLTPKPCPVAAVHVRHYGFGAALKLNGEKVECFLADGFKQGGELSRGTKIAAGTLTVAPDSAVCLVLNGKVKNGHLPAPPGDVTAVEIQIPLAEGKDVESERILLDRLQARAAPPEAKPPKPAALQDPAKAKSQAPPKGDDDDDDG